MKKLIFLGVLSFACLMVNQGMAQTTPTGTSKQPVKVNTGNSATGKVDTTDASGPLKTGTGSGSVNTTGFGNGEYMGGGPTNTTGSRQPGSTSTDSSSRTTAPADSPKASGPIKTGTGSGSVNTTGFGNGEYMGGGPTNTTGSRQPGSTSTDSSSRTTAPATTPAK